MGSFCSKSTTVQLNKKVVILGASYAGLNLAEQLWDNFEVLLIDRQEYYEYKQTNARLIVEDEHIDDITLSYN